MSESDTGWIELTRGEASEVIAALAEYGPVAGSDRRTRVRDLQDLFAREFDLGPYVGNRDEDFLDLSWGDDDDEALFSDPDTDEIQLSRAEAEIVVDALDRHEESDTATEAASVREIIDEFEDEFDLGARGVRDEV